MLKSDESLSTEMEQKIINAASKVFVKWGKKASSMQLIADEAGINRTLLNYYFRSKDKLFNIVFDKIFFELIQKAAEILESDIDIIEKLDRFIDVYISGLLSNPYIPVFILNELNTNPEHLLKLFKDSGLKPIRLKEDIIKAMDQGRIIKTDPLHLIVNLISMIAFPLAAKPLIAGMILSDQNIDFDDFMQERIVKLKEYFLNSIIP
ncbi:MAG: TetR/AcrR family transcriptional regulator [Bacteroidales bacterium]|nr:TetR/AcrR family transcriptional regulator [Bacteroidales bacterium]